MTSSSRGADLKLSAHDALAMLAILLSGDEEAFDLVDDVDYLPRALLEIALAANAGAAPKGACFKGASDCSKFARGEFPLETLTGIAMHLAGCDACRADFEAMEDEAIAELDAWLDSSPVKAPRFVAPQPWTPTWWTNAVRSQLDELCASMPASLMELSVAVGPMSPALRLRSAPAPALKLLSKDGAYHVAEERLSARDGLSVKRREGGVSAKLCCFETDLRGRVTSAIYPIEAPAVEFDSLSAEAEPRIIWFVEGGLCDDPVREGEQLTAERLGQSGSRLVALVPYYKPLDPT